MKTLISTLTISAALLAPVTAFAATTAPAAQATPVTTTATAAPSAQVTSQTNDANTTKVAMNKPQKQNSFGKQTNDDRDGLSRIQEQVRQLSANY